MDAKRREEIAETIINDAKIKAYGRLASNEWEGDYGKWEDWKLLILKTIDLTEKATAEEILTPIIKRLEILNRLYYLDEQPCCKENVKGAGFEEYCPFHSIKHFIEDKVSKKFRVV